LKGDDYPCGVFISSNIERTYVLSSEKSAVSFKQKTIYWTRKICVPIVKICIQSDNQFITVSTYTHHHFKWM